MNELRLRDLVLESVRLDREVARRQERLKLLKGLLIEEARGRVEEHVPTAGGGVSWMVEGGDGCVARVTFPAPSLKSRIDGEGRTIERVREVAGRFFGLLFLQRPSWALAEGFRERALELLGKAGSARLVKLCQSESAAKVSFETKEAVL